MKAPVTEEITVKTEKELIKYCAENIDAIIWEKVEDGYEMKALAQQYLEDPDAYDLLEADVGSKNSISHGRGSGTHIRNDLQSSHKGSNANYFRMSSLQPDFANQLSDCASGFIQRSKGDEKSHITEEEFTETFTLFKTI